MPTIDLRRVPEGDLVLHFGGRPKSINALTFAHSLLSISEALREINGVTNPHQRLEVTIDAVGPGSFRARLKTSAKNLPGLFKGTMSHVVLPIFVWYLTDQILDDDSVNVVVNDDHYVVERGDDRIILPKDVYEARTQIKSDETIRKNVSRTFEVLEDDESVSELSIIPEIDSDDPIATFPRSEFPERSALIEPAVLPENTRIVHERAELVIVRVILKRSKRKWQFVYQGFQISAPVLDDAFYDKIERREVFFGQGDILDARLKIVQTLDEASGAYLNDPNSYEVVEVYDVLGGPRQTNFLTED